MEKMNNQSEPIGKTSEKDSPRVAGNPNPNENGECVYDSKTYSNGAWTCIAGLNHLCVRGTWVHYNQPCESK